MNIFRDVKTDLVRILETLVAKGILPDGLDLSRVTVESPKDRAHGDMATNAAMVLCKQAGMKPRDLADILAKALPDSDLIASAEIAGPGFINMRLKESLSGSRCCAGFCG